MENKLLAPVRLGDYTLKNRVIMAPLTRMRADVDLVPTDLNVEYYRQRASAGLSSVKPPRFPGRVRAILKHRVYIRINRFQVGKK